MVMFNPDAREQGRAFDFELERLSSLVADMRRIREGMPISELVGDAPPLLDRWSHAERPTACLMGYSSGHPLLPGTGRLIVTSDLWLISSDNRWARTLSRWYRLGEPLPESRNSIWKRGGSWQ
ncbi:hypothetical protein NYR54_18375 [Chelativorans sp. SCAU2101]|jgi:hypothetical protein|uniref:Uncharacterized protein n=1 Tax=Chelativorans petroleitrophicus TaxID=2975484 RepID=A0A9X2XC94_9HYPH|nr:DUF6634 family protein [Chelativorans petroleitrophicus]MCT8992221.1 hypothetical protein [Chelativorans petroleitrophicus]